MFDCTTSKYDLLYARWLDNPGGLLDAAHWHPGMRLLDLCGGTGAVSREALRRGAKPGDIVLYDLNPRCPEVTQWSGDANLLDYSPLMTLPPFDTVICRQAINYLDLEENGAFLGRAINRLLKRGGTFIFNTFKAPRWALKTYRFKGRRYFEASGFFGSWVFHVQASPFVGIDVSLFKHHTQECLQKFVRNAESLVLDRGRSQTWISTKGS